MKNKFFYEKRSAVLCAIGILGFVVTTVVFDTIGAGKNSTATVTLQEEGFYPQEIRVRKGGDVLFRTSRKKPFWPASDFHPSHSVYPEFDPRKSIDPDKSWQFQFTKAGRWEYHDHLAPLYKGTVIVAGEDSVKGALRQKESCEGAASIRAACWKELIKEVLRKDGIAAALDVVGRAYMNQPDCHAYSHIVGDETYKLFSQGKEIVLSSKTYYCGYGFYHGFTEAMVQAEGSVVRMREFCDFAAKQSAVTTSGSVGACYHGIGHGGVDGGDPRAWGDPKALTDSAVKLCEQVADIGGLVTSCATGVFGSLQIAYAKSQYGLSLEQVNRDDPLEICRNQPNYYIKLGCYQSMGALILNIAESFSDAAGYIEKIKEDEYAQAIMEDMALFDAYIARYRQKADTTEYVGAAAAGHGGYGTTLKKSKSSSEKVKACMGIQKRLRASCIRGFVMELLIYGPPNFEYKDAIDFCESPEFPEQERNECFKKMTWYLNMIYPPEKFKEICMEVGAKYRALCGPN